uniref:Uncharacterized protein n=1 Tax=Anopheles coluzzii TaxID=1518534 RepID=A0A8W7P2B1_ANOCL
MMADTSTSNGGVAAGSPSVVGGGSGGALDPNVIPQWKKELIQRRKNLAKTIGAVATQVHDSASTVAAAISASASSPVLTHPRTPTGGFPVGSPFYAGTKDATGGGGGGIGGGGVGAGGITALGDAGEELKYGPGIVSRLRCRYLSLALRQSVAKQRPSLNTGGGSEGHATTNGISSSVSPTATMLMNGGKGGGAAGGGAAATPTELPLLVSDCVTIEEKIINGREKGDPKPKRLTSIIDADERPPPDVVKQTMKIFEANANRRGGRGVNGSTNGGSDVATKVASYRSIIISGSATAGATTAAAAVGPGEKPPITHPKPPLSPKKPNIMPRTASPKQQQQQPHQVTAAKPPPTPKSLEAVNNLKNAPSTAAAAAPIVAVKNNNKTPIGGGGGSATSESTPPSPPARSKHTAAAAAAAAAALNGVGVGVAVSKNMQSDDDGTQSADPTADAKTTNALKNGVGTVRDHHQHHDSSSNGTTQTAAAVTPSAKQSAPGSDGGNGGSGHQHKHNGNTALEAAVVPSAASSPTTGICDSPSIQQLTTKLGSLHLATSTPTGAANGSAVSVQDRRNLEYVTSDEEEEEDDDDEDIEEGEGDNVDGENERGRRTNSSRSYQVNPESSESEDARDGAASGGSENDADDDEEAELDDDDERSVRKISRTAMENIARAGTTTQFRFNGAVKSYLPGGAMGKPAAPAPSTKAPAPPIPMSRESLAGKANGASTAAAAVQAIEVSGRLPPEGAPNNSVNGVGGGGSAKQHSSGSTGALLQQGGGGSVGSSTAPSPPSLTRREIEKNQINREKSGEPAVPAAAASSGTNSINGSVASGGGVQVASANNNNNNANSANPSGASGGGGGAKQTSAVDSTTSFVAKWGTGGMVGSGVAAVATAGQSSPLAGLVPVRKKTKPPPSHQQEGTNTMVFNFSDRKDVPDYIENDGVIIRPRPRELPKPTASMAICGLQSRSAPSIDCCEARELSGDGGVSSVISTVLRSGSSSPPAHENISSVETDFRTGGWCSWSLELASSCCPSGDGCISCASSCSCQSLLARVVLAREKWAHLLVF